MKQNRKNINGVIGSTIYISILMIILIGLVKSYLADDLKQSDIIRFKGTVTSYKEDRIGGARSHQVGFIKMTNTNLTFKISNTSFKVLKMTDFEKYLKVGESVEVGTTKDELDKAENTSISNKILNALVDTRINPQTYFLSNQNRQLFDLKKYNDLEKSRNKSNLIWGLPLTLIAVGLFGGIAYHNWKTRF